MPVSVGIGPLTAAKIGTTALTKIALGAVTIWPSTATVTLGWSGSRAVQVAYYHNQIYWGYEELALHVTHSGVWVVVHTRDAYGGFNTVVAQGTWLTPPAAGVGTGYEVRIVTQSDSHAEYASPDLDWVKIDTTRSVWVRATIANAAYNYTIEKMYTVQIRAVGTSTLLVDTTMNLKLSPY